MTFKTIAKSIGMLAGTGPALLVIGKSMETAIKCLERSKASNVVATVHQSSRAWSLARPLPLQV